MSANEWSVGNSWGNSWGGRRQLNKNELPSAFSMWPFDRDANEGHEVAIKGREWGSDDWSWGATDDWHNWGGSSGKSGKSGASNAWSSGKSGKSGAWGSDDWSWGATDDWHNWSGSSGKSGKSGAGMLGAVVRVARVAPGMLEQWQEW
ncbi:hypothetical protein QTG54_002046 [Skeletonema marinoi]|uniref:Uncharacterized protein n=1 Tax=Skeletonema marinoi TaxID=267567 RepID=A0AAD8YIH4_9STRA|nr:hypothetical protein QTG54_002046 [Skeletonema marinoi]